MSGPIARGLLLGALDGREEPGLTAGDPKKKEKSGLLGAKPLNRAGRNDMFVIYTKKIKNNLESL